MAGNAETESQDDSHMLPASEPPAASESPCGKPTEHQADMGESMKPMTALWIAMSSILVAIIIIMLVHALAPVHAGTAVYDGYPALGPEAVANSSNGADD